LASDNTNLAPDLKIEMGVRFHWKWLLDAAPRLDGTLYSTYRTWTEIIPYLPILTLQEHELRKYE
jgi:hypothetical protein